MYSSCSQHLIDPLPPFIQWLSVKIVSASITTMEFILVFLNATKAEDF